MQQHVVMEVSGVLEDNMNRKRNAYKAAAAGYERGYKFRLAELESAAKGYQALMDGEVVRGALAFVAVHGFSADSEHIKFAVAVRNEFERVFGRLPDE